MAVPSHSPAVLHAWIEALERYPSQELTTWEENFLLSVGRQLTLRGSLSTQQVKILERIHTEKAA